MMTVARAIRAAAVALLLTGLLMGVAPRTASACSCMMTPLADRLAADRIHTVFTGTATGAEGPTGPTFSSADLETWTFTVDAVHKGAASRTMIIGTPVDSASCGIDFIVDRRYLVLAGSGADGVPTAMLCDGSTALDALSADDLALLGAGTSPSPGAAAPSGAAAGEDAIPSHPGFWLAVVLGAVLAGAGALAVRRRRRA
jgi:hypothetical protein